MRAGACTVLRHLTNSMSDELTKAGMREQLLAGVQLLNEEQVRARPLFLE
jgi:hypothetical protein